MNVDPCQCGHERVAHRPGCRYCDWCGEFRKGEFSEELFRLAEIGLAMAKRDLQRTGGVKPLFIFRLPDGKTTQLALPEYLADVMNDGGAKDMIFDFMRRRRIKLQATATVFVTDSWRGEVSAKEHKQADITELLSRHGFDGLVKLGIIKPVEAATVSVQTEEWSLTLSQTYERHETTRSIKWLEVSLMQYPQKDIDGRTKMFGSLTTSTERR